MTQRDVDRIKVLHLALQKKITQEKAGELLFLSREQANRICQKIKRTGDRAVIHGLRGQPSNHQLPKGLADKAVEKIKGSYNDFGPTLAAEKLLLLEDIKLSDEKIRQLMISAKIWKPKKRKAKHRQWRERKDCLGEMEQMDGSDHAWFEKRNDKCILLASIDDATNKVFLRFSKHEDTRELMRFTRTYIEKFGRPISFYVDKDSIYITNRQPNLEEELRGSYAITQFTRAMEKDLNTKVLTAHSPQAKGRVERLFKTLQDRLVKELRLANISSIEEANKFLDDYYISFHNKKFSVLPKTSVDLHRPLNKTRNKLDRIFSIQENRVLSNDYTVRWRTRLLQIKKHQPFFLLPRTPVTIEERLDASLRVRYKGAYLNFKEISKAERRMPNEQAETSPTKQNNTPYVPPKDHPWRKPIPFIGKYSRPMREVSVA